MEATYKAPRRARGCKVPHSREVYGRAEKRRLTREGAGRSLFDILEVEVRATSMSLGNCLICGTRVGRDSLLVLGENALSSVSVLRSPWRAEPS